MPRVATEYRYVFNADGQFYAQAHGWKSRLLSTARAAAAALAKKLDIGCDALRKVPCPCASFPWCFLDSTTASHIFYSAQKGHAVQKVVLSFITSMCGAGCARCSCQDDELGRGVLASRKAGMGLKERHTWSALHGSCCSPGQCHCASAQAPMAAEDKRIWPAVTLPPRHLPLGEAG